MAKPPAKDQNNTLKRKCIDLEAVPNKQPTVAGAVHTDSATAQLPQDIFPFLNFPRELRDMVYEHSLNWNDVSDHVASITSKFRLPPTPEHIKLIDGALPTATTPTVLLINRQITEEASRIYKKRTLVLDVLAVSSLPDVVDLTKFITVNTLRTIKNLRLVIPNKPDKVSGSEVANNSPNLSTYDLWIIPKASIWAKSFADLLKEGHSLESLEIIEQYHPTWTRVIGHSVGYFVLTGLAAGRLKNLERVTFDFKHEHNQLPDVGKDNSETTAKAMTSVIRASRESNPGTQQDFERIVDIARSLSEIAAKVLIGSRSDAT